MDIVESRAGRAKVAALSGRLDTATAPSVEAALLGMLAGGNRLVADLGAVRYVSAAGLRVLLKAAKQARAEGGGFAVAAPQPEVRGVLETGGFEEVLTIHATREAAAAALG